MSRHIRTHLGIVLLLAVAASSLVAGEAAWTRLGARQVADRAEHDTIVVGADEGQFTAIRLDVLGPPVHIRDLKVHFRNGQVQDVEVRSVIPRGGATRAIDLVGDERVIARVELSYEANSRRRGKGSHIVLWGRR